MLQGVIRFGVDVVGRPIDAIAAMRSGPSVVALIYHRVGERTPSPVDLSRSAFSAQVDLLAESGRAVDLDTAVAILCGDRARPEQGPAVVLTFDDGTADWVDVVLPELVERSLPATFYVATDFVERQRTLPDGGTPISWAGLGELVSTGLATVGSHTHTHRVLARADAPTTEDEALRSAELLEGHLGRSCRHFAYPKAIAPSPAAEVVVRRRFDTAALAGNRANPVGGSDLHRLGRHALTRGDDIARFERKLAGGAVLEGALRSVRDAW